MFDMSYLKKILKEKIVNNMVSVKQMAESKE